MKDFTRHSARLAAVGFIAATTVGSVGGAASAGTHTTTLRSLWNTTTSGYVLTDCTASQAQGTAGLSAQTCFGTTNESNRVYVGAVFAVTNSASATSSPTISATVRNVERHDSVSGFLCLGQTVAPGQTLYCMTGGSPTGQPWASDIFTASGRLTSAKTVYARISTPATQF